MLTVLWIETIILLALAYHVSFLVPLVLGRKRVGLVAPAVGVAGADETLTHP